MCKIMIFTNASKLNQKSASEAIGNILIKTNPDGFGYAIKGEHGIFGEKCIAKSFKTRIGIGGQITKKEPTLPIVPRYEMFGTPGTLTGPAIFHGRISTNGHGLVNTHPMQLSESFVRSQIAGATGGGEATSNSDQREDIWHLIHNGVITDLGGEYQKFTENDSEDLLFRFIAEGIRGVEKHVWGYYAFAAIDPAGRLHIVRDHIADLYVAWSKDLESFVYATAESLILSVAKKLKFKVGPIEQIEECTYVIFEGNKLIHTEDFKSNGTTRRESRHSAASIGRVLDGRTGRVIDATTNESLDFARLFGPVDHDENTHPIIDIDASRFNDDGGVASTTSDDKKYNDYLNEISHLDESYTILDENEKEISIREFMDKDMFSRQCCTIIRNDGTVVSPDGELPSVGLG